MRELLLEIINEAQTGQVIIDDEKWPICFNTLLKENNRYYSYVQNKNFPILLLDNLEEFLSLLDEYLKLETIYNRRHPIFINNFERNLKKFLISYLFVNATTEDFINPCTMLRTKIAFLKNQTLKNFHQSINLENIPNSKLNVTNIVDSVFMETPNKIEIVITNDNDKYSLPSISYGIVDNTCYIYSILNPKQEITTSYQKKIKRLLYKINDSVPESEMNVSPSAVLSLSIFLTILKLHNIKNVKVVPYLPLRYLSRDLLAKDNLQLNNRNDFIQNNATNKFIDTFIRLNYHGIIDIISYPYELDDCLSLTINNLTPNNNSFLSNVNKRITK